MITQNQITDDNLPKWLWLWTPVILILVLLITGVSLPGEVYDRWIGNERSGILETSHAIIPAISFLICLRILVHKNLKIFSGFWFWILIAALGSFYMSGEEASWGQHWFQWGTSSEWAAINDQGETNLHNTSSWLDQKPRTILEIGIIFGGIILPLFLHYRPEYRSKSITFIIPTLVLLPTAIIGEIARMIERTLGALNASFRLFQRASEVQELFFALFILFYLIIFLQRLNNLNSPLPK